MPTINFKVPQINFDASHNSEIIEWKSVTEPPLLKILTENQLFINSRRKNEKNTALVGG